MGEDNSHEARARQEESQRILKRLQQEQTGAQGIVQRGLERTASHFSADDAPDNDRLEVWGTRIGRALGLLITLAVIGWLVFYLMQNKPA